MANARTTLIIPNYNGAVHLASVLPSIAAQSRPVGRIVVVDNHSTDDSYGVAAGSAEWIGLTKNHGFAYAVNRGLETVESEFVALVNNDVILDSDWLAGLENALDDHSIAFACPLLIAAHSRGQIDGAWDLVSRSGCPHRALHGESIDHPAALDARDVDLAPMTATLFRTSLFRQIGTLDEGYISYLEDVDFCLRAALAGHHGRYVPAARALHTGSATMGAWSEATTYWNARNQLLLIARNFPASLIRTWWRPILAGQLLYLFLCARRGHLWPALRGKLEILRTWNQWRSRDPAAGDLGNTNSNENLSRLLARHEREIKRLGASARSGSTFWKIYLRLAGSPGGLP